MKQDNPLITNRRLAQYGGVGGASQQSWQPGSSPIGGKGSGGNGINQLVVDQGLDATMCQTHRPADPNPERNVEVRLEPLHAYYEGNAIPYNLSPSERERWRMRREIRRRESYFEQAERRMFENSPAYINAHFPIKLEHNTPLDAMLETRRKIDLNAPRDPREDEWQVPDKPTRVHASVNRRAEDWMHRAPNRMRGDNEDDRDKDAPPEDPFGAVETRLKTFPMGNQTFLQTGTDVQDHLDEPALNDFGGGAGPNLGMLAFDYPAADEVHYTGAKGASPTLDSPLPATPAPFKGAVNNPGMGTEGKLRMLKKQPGDRVQDPYNARHYDQITGQGKDTEVQGISDAYPENGAYQHGNEPMPRSSSVDDDMNRIIDAFLSE